MMMMKMMMMMMIEDRIRLDKTNDNDDKVQQF